VIVCQVSVQGIHHIFSSRDAIQHCRPDIVPKSLMQIKLGKPGAMGLVAEKDVLDNQSGGHCCADTGVTVAVYAEMTRPPRHSA
jgi:ribosomal protein RSM22 (predicted rRNA methylase)